MTLDLKFEIFDLKGQKVEEKAATFIADCLLNHKGDSLKLYELALQINKGKPVEIDTTDLKLIETAVRENQRYNNLIKGAILKELDAQRATKKGNKTGADT